MRQLISVLGMLIGIWFATPANAQDAPPRKPIDSPPYVFAGIRYGAPSAEAIQVFGQPEAIDKATASHTMSWAGGKFKVSYYENTGLINGFTVVGRDGALWVLDKAQEPMLRLLAWTKEKAISTMGPPAKIWYKDTRLMWNYEVDRRTSGSIFLECTAGAQQPCDEMKVHWTGTALWDPNDGVDELGLRTSPICSPTDAAKRIIGKRLPTGRTASNDRWRMEIYENAQTGSWSLEGASRAKASDTRERCTLAMGSERGGYVDTKWYRAYFAH